MLTAMDHRSRGQSERSRIVAVLGPTNTGKTYLAMERMLGHESGIIGFPLRLLARENYERAVAIKGRRHVALITGEEKIVPPEARYFLCTVEAMPVSRQVAFLGIDEIQMCADPDRGHIFTDRLLNARGSLETMVMGAETIRPLLRRLIPEAEFITRPRFSALRYGGHGKITRLPPKSAVVTFSVADVYAIAELIRRQRGGAAVVLGALSPRTRNAQVEMYQAGEVAYLVATDAIGMGLNMNIEHVALAALRKFDGRVPRALGPAELAQIAGRAGRHMKDGTFGTTAEVDGLDEETAEAIENSVFAPVRALFWRNSALTFASVGALRASLSRPSGRPDLVRAREADDEVALAALARDPEIAVRARGREAVERLWDVCRVPDFGKVMSDGHARLLGRIYRFLCGPDGRDGRLPTDWVAGQVERIDRVEGDIDILMQRIANIRTWTYVSHRGEWLDDAAGWQERTRAIEDKLSDALHERLIQRFVDRRTASLVGRMHGRTSLTAALNDTGEVLVEGHFVGHLEGFRFTADPSVTSGGSTGGGGPNDAGRSVTAAALRALAPSIRRRIEQVEGDGDDAFAIAADGRITWREAIVGRLNAGADVLAPRVEALPSELLDASARTRLHARLIRFVDARLRRRLAALFAARDAALDGAARGLVFQVTESLGSLPRRGAATQIEALCRADRRALGALGLRIGRESVYFPALLHPDAIALRALLWRVHAGDEGPASPDGPSLPRALSTEGFWQAVGYRVLGPRAIRVDTLERLAARLDAVVHGRSAPMPEGEFAGLTGCDAEALDSVLAALGWRLQATDSGGRVFAGGKTRAGAASRRRHPPAGGDKPGSPFAVLEVLRSAR